MPHWFIELQGEAFDTDEFTYWFPDGPDVFAVTEDKKCFLTGLAFLDCVDPSQVQETAERYIDELHSIIFLLQAGVKRPSVGTLFEVMPDGARRGHILLESRISLRAKLRANLQAEGKPANKTQAQILLEAARSSHNLRVALTILALPHASWSHLYRCMEEIEEYLQAKVYSLGFCSEKERERFTRTANTGESAGLEARHSIGKFLPPKNPMTIIEARGFVTGIAQKAVRKAAASLGALNAA